LHGVTHDVIIRHDIKLMRVLHRGLKNGRISVKERKSRTARRKKVKK
jgi:hypothetical protein